MSTASETIALAMVHKGCLGKAAPDEPVFVLRAQDTVAVDLIEKWVRTVEAINGASEKTREARQVLIEFQRWRQANPERVKVPD